MQAVKILADQMTVEVDTYPTPHYLSIGDAFTIRNIRVGGTTPNVFDDGFFQNRIVQIFVAVGVAFKSRPQSLFTTTDGI